MRAVHRKNNAFPFFFCPSLLWRLRAAYHIEAGAAVRLRKVQAGSLTQEKPSLTPSAPLRFNMPGTQSFSPFYASLPAPVYAMQPCLWSHSFQPMASPLFLPHVHDCHPLRALHLLCPRAHSSPALAQPPGCVTHFSF